MDRTIGEEKGEKNVFHPRLNYFPPQTKQNVKNHFPKYCFPRHQILCEHIILQTSNTPFVQNYESHIIYFRMSENINFPIVVK